MYYGAIENTGRPAYLIKGNKIIGIMMGGARRADEFVCMNAHDDRSKELLKDHRYVQLWADMYPDKKFRYATFRYAPITGMYIGGEFADSTDEDMSPLEGTYVADCFNFDWGLVPKELFAQVEGFGKSNAIPEHPLYTDPTPQVFEPRSAKLTASTKVEMWISSAKFPGRSQINLIHVSLLERDDTYLTDAQREAGEEGWSQNNTQEFMSNEVEYALEAFVDRVLNKGEVGAGFQITLGMKRLMDHLEPEVKHG